MSSAIIRMSDKDWKYLTVIERVGVLTQLFADPVHIQNDEEAENDNGETFVVRMHLIKILLKQANDQIQEENERLKRKVAKLIRVVDEQSQ